MQSEKGSNAAVATPPMLFTGAQGDDGGREEGGEEAIKRG